ncbi:MAG: hypothetical protein EOO40_09840 [Deltaproteobacteria bacterium]|nr:MAG: hypothetical protein EOO40_09840 [Deltaproteobacteria bacterium]
MLRRLSCVVAVIILPALAQAHDSQEGLRAATQGYFTGRWACKGQVTVPHQHRRFDTVGSLKFKGRSHGMAVDHFKNHAGSGETFSTMGWTHYDELNKRLQRYAATNSGSWGRFVSDGWQGDTFIWTGKMTQLLDLNHEVSVTETIHRQNNDTFDWTVVLHQAAADDQPIYQGQCSRSPGAQQSKVSGLKADASASAGDETDADDDEETDQDDEDDKMN